MLLAEALIERKQLVTGLPTLQAKYLEAAIVDGDDPSQYTATEAMETLLSSMYRVEELNYRINRTNNEVLVAHRRMTEQIAHRDGLKQSITLLNGVVNSLKGRNSDRRMYGEAIAPKKELAPGVVINNIQALIDGKSKELRLLDVAMQAANWANELL